MTTRMRIMKKTTSIGKDVERLDPSDIADGIVKWCTHLENK